MQEHVPVCAQDAPFLIHSEVLTSKELEEGLKSQELQPSQFPVTTF